MKLERDAQGALGPGSARIAVLKAGDTLDVERPRGNFHPDVEADTPLVLAAAGIGVTPIMNMLDRVTRDGRRKVFAAFGMRAPDQHPLVNELKALMAERPNLEVKLAYSQYDGEPVAGLARAQARTACARRSPAARGSAACRSLSLRSGRHSSATCTTAWSRPASIRCASATRRSGRRHCCRRDGDLAADPAAKFNVTFARSNMEAVWTPASGTLLNLAEAAGVSPTFGCRAGSCGLCRTAISEGRVSYVEPIDEPEAGYVYPCCAIPETDCRLEM